MGSAVTTLKELAMMQALGLTQKRKPLAYAGKESGDVTRNYGGKPVPRDNSKPKRNRGRRRRDIETGDDEE